MCVLSPITIHAVSCNDCAADWLKLSKSLQIALILFVEQTQACCCCNRLYLCIICLETLHSPKSDVSCPVWRRRVPEACPIRVMVGTITTSTFRRYIVPFEARLSTSNSMHSHLIRVESAWSSPFQVHPDQALILYRLRNGTEIPKELTLVL